MSFVSLPVTPGTMHAATRQPDHHPNEHSETPFASLLDTGTGPRILEKSAPRAERPRQSDRAAHANTSQQKPAPSARKNESPNTQPSVTEASNGEDQDTTESEMTMAAIVIERASEIEAASIDAADVADTADTGTDKTDTPATPDPATIGTPVVTATTATTVAAPVQQTLEFAAASEQAADGEAPIGAPGAAVAEAPALTPADAQDASAESASASLAGKVTPKAEESADAVAQERAAKAKKNEAVAAAGDDPAAENAKSDQPLKVHQPEAQQHVAARAEHHSAAKPKIEAPADATPSAAAAGTAAQAEAASNLPSNITNGPQPNAPLPGTPAASGQTPQQPAVAVPISGIAVEIVTQAREGKNRFEIRLDPPELGRVDVRLDIDGQGNVTSRLVVERQDTLDLLRRESSALERALHDAGLKTGNDGLQFSLRDQGSNHARRDDTPGRFTRAVIPTEAAAGSERSSYRLPWLGGLDIRI